MKLLLVDDHALFRAGLRALLEPHDHVEGIAEAGDCPEALERLGEAAFDIVLLDYKLPGTSGLEALAAVREARPEIPVVIVSGEDDPGTVRVTIEAGAMGFVPKSSRPEILSSALNLIVAGGIYLPPDVLDSDAAPHPAGPRTNPFDQLTKRQMDVILCCIQGKPNKLIARELDISVHTVKAHLSAVYAALDVPSRSAAVYEAARHGIGLPN